jgi:adenosylmethionine-8-amino-7-oxononanoate aminotransferase
MMSDPAWKHTAVDRAREAADHLKREFYRRMAEQGMIVRPPTAGPGWMPPEPLDISADELSAMVVRLRQGS